MAHFYVRNSLNYNKTIKINISFVRGYDVNDDDGDPRWLLELGTTEKAVDGSDIQPQYVNNVTDQVRLNNLIADAVAKISSQVDWGPLLDDTVVPYVDDIKPSAINNDVPIESNVDITVKDDMPSSGLDLSDMKVTIATRGSTFDITNECKVEGTPFEYRLHWEPPVRRYEYNDGG